MKVVGIMLDESVFRNISRGIIGKEKLNYYNKAARSCGLTTFYLTLNQIYPSSGYAMGYKYAGGKYHYVKMKIPRVIHNRALSPRTAKMRLKYKQLNRISYVFNADKGHSKHKINKILTRRFPNHLPVTVSYSKQKLQSMMRRYDNLFIKPQKSSLGRGIINITKTKGKWSIRMPHRKLVQPAAAAVSTVHRMACRRPYLIQKGIQLAKWHGRPYDIRVTVQRNGSGQWHVTGMAGKVAGKGKHVTNVAQGGSVRTTNELFRHSFGNPKRVTASVKNVSLQITKHLSKKIRRLADVGLDMGVDQRGKPYFIELNCRDQRYSFQLARMYDTYYQTFKNPILYAKYKLNRKG